MEVSINYTIILTLAAIFYLVVFFLFRKSNQSSVKDLTIKKNKKEEKSKTINPPVQRSFGHHNCKNYKLSQKKNTENQLNKDSEDSYISKTLSFYEKEDKVFEEIDTDFEDIADSYEESKKYFRNLSFPNIDNSFSSRLMKTYLERSKEDF